MKALTFEKIDPALLKAVQSLSWAAILRVLAKQHDPSRPRRSKDAHAIAVER